MTGQQHHAGLWMLISDGTLVVSFNSGLGSERQGERARELKRRGVTFREEGAMVKRGR